jgi:4-hydroxy-tetrahydrodipicolinate reductase
MVKAIVAGAAGRMGARIINMIHQGEGITLAGAFEHPKNRYVDQDAGHRCQDRRISG